MRNWKIDGAPEVHFIPESSFDAIVFNAWGAMII